MTVLQTCKTWSHYRCQDIDRTDRDQWRHNIKLPYICMRCRSNDDGSFDFLMGLQRIEKASTGGHQKLLRAAERENLFIKNVPFDTSTHSEFRNHSQDQTANTLLTHFHANDKTALHSTPDGDCFFNSVSTLMSGNEGRSTEMRYRCCLELVLKKSQIMLHSQYKRLTVLCPPLEQDCINCARAGTYSSMHMFIAMSRLLNLPIKVFYPAVNGMKIYNFRVMNTLLRPPFADPEKGTLNLMWSSTSPPVNPPTPNDPWNPNHIVPLVDNVQKGPLCLMSDFFHQKDSMHDHVPVPSFTSPNKYEHLTHETIDVEDDVDTDKENVQPKTCHQKLRKTTRKQDSKTKRKARAKSQTSEVGSHPVRDAALCAPTENHRSQTSEIYTSNLSTINESESENIEMEIDENCHNDSDIGEDTSYKHGPLHKFMDIYETINTLSGPYTVLDNVPTGHKDGNYYVVDNEHNNARRSNGKNSEFWDDRGSWTNGASPTFSFLKRDDKFITIHKRNGVYCLEKMRDKKKVYEPLEPQPALSELLIIKRLYNILKASEKGPNQFKRRCTWVLNRPSTLLNLSMDTALIEYIGCFPGRRLHGNATKTTENYIRTKDSVRTILRGELENQSVNVVKNKMNRKTKDEHSKQRNVKQLRNIKYEKTNSEMPAGNTADHIICVEEMVKTHDLVNSVKHLKGLQHPVITLFNEQQIVDIKRFCGI